MTKRGAYDPWFQASKPATDGPGCPILAAKLRQARIDARMSQSDVAELFSISRALWGHYEMNRRAVPERLLNKILETFEDARNWGLQKSEPYYPYNLKCDSTPLEAAASSL